jgi:hypothetical protein
MTLKTVIVSDASSVFHNVDEFAELVTFYPGGDELTKSTVTAVVVWDEMEGTRESYGDGVTLERDNGTAVRSSAKLEILATIAVDDTRRPADLFKLADGTMVAVKRILGKDGGMQTILCTRRDNVSIRKPTKSG